MKDELKNVCKYIFLYFKALKNPLEQLLKTTLPVHFI